MEKITLYQDTYGFLHETEEECEIIENSTEDLVIKCVNGHLYREYDTRTEQTNENYVAFNMYPSVKLLHKRLHEDDVLEVLFLVSIDHLMLADGVECEDDGFTEYILYQFFVTSHDGVLEVEAYRKASSMIFSKNCNIEDYPNEDGFTYTWAEAYDLSAFLSRRCKSLCNVSLGSDDIVRVLAQAVARKYALFCKHDYPTD